MKWLTNFHKGVVDVESYGVVKVMISDVKRINHVYSVYNIYIKTRLIRFR